MDLYKANFKELKAARAARNSLRETKAAKLKFILYIIGAYLLLNVLIIATIYFITIKPIIGIAIGISTIIIAIVGFLYLNYIFVLKYQDSMFLYERNDDLYGVDAMFCGDKKARVILNGYKYYYECIVNLKNKDGKALQANINLLQYNVFKRKEILIGFIADKDLNRYSFGIYSSHTDTDKWIEKYMKKSKIGDFRISKSEDENWDILLNKYIPTDEECDRVADRLFIESLISSGFDFTKEADQICTFVFKDKTDCEAFKVEAEQKDYCNISIIDKSEKDKSIYEVKCEMRGMLGFNRLTLLTKEAKAFARKYNGDFISREVK